MKTLKATKIKPTLLDRYDLQYVYPDDIAITRVKRGRGFSYQDLSGNIINDTTEKKRLQNIAVPPTYNDVLYCTYANGHIQATGKDSKNKKQYFYHPDWEHLREMTKFSFMSEFGKALPRFRRKVNGHLKDTDLDQSTILAAMGRILDRTGMRVGSDTATTTNKTHGLTTLQKEHLHQDGNKIEFIYKGKGGHDIDRYLTDKKIADVIDQCVDIPGQRLFEYEDEKATKHNIDSADLNKFIKDTMGADFTAKDFRTWRFSCLFLEKTLKLKDKDTLTLKLILESVSEETGNTPAILKSSYIHPGLIQILKKSNWKELENPKNQVAGLRQDENIFLNYLSSNHSKKSLAKES